jgi:putative transposase
MGVQVTPSFYSQLQAQDFVWELRNYLGEVFHRLSHQRESQILEGHLMPDHVHMLVQIPPKYAVSQVVGYIKGKCAIHLARVYAERKRNFVSQQF